jgi:hypothetical protein
MYLDMFSSLRARSVCGKISDCVRQSYVDNYWFGGARGGTVVEALRYKPEGRGIDSAASVV